MVDDLKASLREAQSRCRAGTTAEGRPDNVEEGSVIMGLEDARDDALESLDQSQWEMDRMK